MNNCVAIKEKLNAICHIYHCTCNVIENFAMQCVLKLGQQTCADNAWYTNCMKDIDDAYDQAETRGEVLIGSRNVDKPIIECAKELAQLAPYDFFSLYSEMILSWRRHTIQN